MNSLFLAINRGRWTLKSFYMPIYLHLRLQSASKLLSSWENHTVEVSCRSSGCIRVDFYNQHLLKNPTTPLVVYLPPTGVHLSQYHPPIPSYLLPASKALARINYRWNIPLNSRNSLISHPCRHHFQSGYHPFPFPIHDTLQAWTYITESYLPSFHSVESLTAPKSEAKNLGIRSPSVISKSPLLKRPIIIYGEFLGATLATSLALTENFESFNKTLYDVRLIAKQGVYDWADVGTTLLKKDLFDIDHRCEESGHVDEIWDQLHLLRLRERLFSGPDKCLDVFASPSLFFRQPGISAPKLWTELNQPSYLFYPCFIQDIRDPQLLSKEDSELKSSKLRNFGSLGYQSKLLEVLNLKKSHTSLAIRPYLVFPLIDSGLRIPNSLFLYSKLTLKKSKCEILKAMEIPTSKLEAVTPMHQTQEMVNLMRRSISMYSYEERYPENTIQIRELRGDFVEECNIVTQWIDAMM